MDAHDHDAIVHDHQHVHVTHYLRHGSDLEHELATHARPHDHPAVAHQHEAHTDPAKEHEREAHVHDHRHTVWQSVSMSRFTREGGPGERARILA